MGFFGRINLLRERGAKNGNRSFRYGGVKENDRDSDFNERNPNEYTNMNPNYLKRFGQGVKNFARNAVGGAAGVWNVAKDALAPRMNKIRYKFNRARDRFERGLARARNGSGRNVYEAERNDARERQAAGLIGQHVPRPEFGPVGNRSQIEVRRSPNSRLGGVIRRRNPPSPEAYNDFINSRLGENLRLSPDDRRINDIINVEGYDNGRI
jgi:hypothetical protein